MFGRGFKKIPTTCTFTVHNIRLPEIITDDFEVQWKRAEHEGITEHAISNDDVDVFFEKTFKCKVVMYVSKKDNSVRAKYMNFVVNRYIKGITKKVFGKLEVDISQFYNAEPTVKEFKIESPHSKKSSLFMTFVVKPDSNEDGKIIETESDLTSTSEAINPVSEHQEDWDISEAATEEQRKRISDFFEERETEKTPQLSQFQSNPRFKRTHSKQNFNLSSTDLFKSNMPPPPSALKGNLFGKKIRHNASGMLNTQKQNSESNLLTAPSEIIFSEKDAAEAATELMHKVLSKQWGQSPLVTYEIPKASIVIHAMLLESKVFDENTILPLAFEDFTNDFIKRLRLSVVVSRATELDRFTMCLYNVLLLQRERGHGALRREKLIKELISLCSFYIGSIVEKSIEPIISISRHLIAGVEDTEALAPKFVEEIKNCNEKITEDDWFRDFFRKRIIEMTDAQLVSILTQSPLRCTFGFSIKLNSFLTILSDKGIEFPKFREAVAVLQMGCAICADPKAANDICPTLPKVVVAEILSNQQPDEFMPMPNDVMNYVRAFDVDMTKSPEIPCDYTGNFSEIQHNLPTADWKSASFDENVIAEFPFFNNYFRE